MGSVFRRGSIWWVKYRGPDGDVRRESTPARTSSEARVLLREVEARAFQQERGLEPMTINPEGWTLGDMMRWWLEQ
jgi:hypothetical protein